MTQMRHRLIETTLDDLKSEMGGLLRGEVAAVLVRNSLSESACDRVFQNFASSAGVYERSDGVSGKMVGTNAFLKSAHDVVDDYARNNGFAELLFHGATNLYRHLFDSVEEAGFRFRHAYIDGVPAPTHRATVWTDSGKDRLALRAHTDWPQVRHSGMEYSDVEHPVAVNFYPRHPAPGSSFVRLYDFVPAGDWLETRGILKSGYPICLDELEGIDYIDVHPVAGDTLLFAASKVHAVFQANQGADDVRLNINGFIGLSRASNKVLAWA
ncbi:hypothetical protein L2Y94_00120 [Luteibacter aegosomatis]|uniref:hypothetical protein n=1 Tax=Luteibacter aegosomatis TaxID=2911537 RepID=UPI001FFAC269|nr:hypothetical protein [Luteibacter aegosomatis]UPG85803.1 hypothetical protein L2Y94_00120 [Luteibacter aegosomatis]